jgi:broad specificity phosphatase PhoE
VFLQRRDVMPLQIFLVRHGRPSCDERSRIRGRDYPTWVRNYSAAPLDLAVMPPGELVSYAANAGCVITSSISRARASAALLAPDRPILAEPLFDEAAMPHDIGLDVALSPGVWDFWARVAWFFGRSRGGESLGQALTRARAATQRLAELAHEHGSVMLVGHGMMNALIRHQLRRTGWSTSALRSAYWSLMVATSR